MSNTTKPHIKPTGSGRWECADAYLARSGKTWKEAYDRWLTASLCDAMAQIPTKPKAPKLAKFRKLETSEPKPQLRQSGTATPKKAGQPITTKATPKAQVKPIKQPSYHESMVRQMPSPLNRHEYVPPAGLLQNMARAAEVQQPLISISTGNRSES